jgi:diguanylate cyclase (GGDEF)-like protein
MLLTKFKKITGKIIYPIPPGMKDEYGQIRLRLSINGLIILGTAEIFLSLINILFAKIFPLTYSANDFPSHKIYIYLGFILLLAIINVLVYKAGRIRTAWVMCILFTGLVYSFSIINMYYVTTDTQFLFLFASTLFVNMFLFDFKPIVFIPSAIIFFIISFFLKIYIREQVHGFINLYKYFIEIFLATIAVKILFYNSRVKSYVYNHELKLLTKTDELTNLDNRRSLLEYMDILWKQCVRMELPVNIFMIDIDYFKKYNDLFGHVAGDKALIAVAQCLKKEIKRKTDFIARYGGEEFVCLLPYIDKESAFYIAEKLVQNMEDLQIRHPKNDCSRYLTISIGVASRTPQANDSPMSLLDEADKALYMAKNTGRNKVIAIK